jgi:hypothetical protein
MTDRFRSRVERIRSVDERVADIYFRSAEGEQNHGKVGPHLTAHSPFLRFNLVRCRVIFF